jgi:hypothetical protein
MTTNGNTLKRSMVDTTAAVNYPGVAVAVGGLLGLAGVFLNWFAYSYQVSGGTLTVYLKGNEDWTGQVAFIAGIAAFAFALANMILADPQIRRLTGALMGVAAVLLLGACLAGFFRVDSVTASPVLLGVEPGSSVTIATGVTGGLLVSAVGGIFAVAGALLSLRPADTLD